MPFKPGKSGNPKGRPSGPIPAIQERRAKIQALVDAVLDDQESINELINMKGPAKWDIVAKLLPYAIAKLESEVPVDESGKKVDFYAGLLDALNRKVG